MTERQTTTRIDVSDIISGVLGLVPEETPAEQPKLTGDEPHERLYCTHHSIIVSAHDRQVTCRTCTRVLDPFDVLLGYATKERSLREWATETRAKQTELEALRDEERKVKARVKSASRKDAHTAVAAERARGERERDQIIQAARDIAAGCRRIERITQRRRSI